MPEHQWTPDAKNTCWDKDWKAKSEHVQRKQQGPIPRQIHSQIRLDKSTIVCKSVTYYVHGKHLKTNVCL